MEHNMNLSSQIAKHFREVYFGGPVFHGSRLNYQGEITIYYTKPRNLKQT
jgi:hypothetical protein